MSTESERKRYADRLAKEWADKGKVMEGGWRAFDHFWLKGCSDLQRAEMRKAFFIGGQHLFACVMGFMDEDREPTENDLRRMSQLQQELQAFELELRASHPPGNA